MKKRQNLKHLNQKWVVIKDEEGFFCLATDTKDTLYIAQVFGCLPGDNKGKKTLQYLCALHNTFTELISNIGKIDTEESREA